MICLLVSSKTMNVAQTTLKLPTSTPLFIDKAALLQKKVSPLSLKDMQRIMHVSKNLATATKQRMQDWTTDGPTPAWLSFQGDVYKGLQAETFTEDDFIFAQQCAATISGLYGIVRPLDLVAPYRLEIGYKLPYRNSKNLYEFWGDHIAQALPKLQDKTQKIINLSSEEYIKAIRPYVASERIITPWFMQIKDGTPEFQAIHAKIARGSVMRWIVKNRISDANKLTQFSEDRYRYDQQLSTPQKPVFTREFIPVATAQSSPQ